MIRKSRIPLFVVSALLLCALAALVFFFSPSSQFTISAFGNNIQLSILYPFFILLSLFSLFIVTALFNSIIHGVLVALFISTYLVLRLNSLNDLFFLIILIGIFLTLELLFSHGKKHRLRRQEKMRQIKY